MPVVKTSKEEVLLKAAQVIRQRGYAYTSMQDLAKACGIQPSHFYYYFKDKEDLMTAILQSAVERFNQYIGIIADDESLEPVDRLDKMLKKMAKSFLFTEGGCLMGNTVLETAYLEPHFIGVLKAFFESYIGALKKIYQAKFTEKYAQNLAEQVVQDLQGGIMLSLLFRDDNYTLKAFNRAKMYLQ